MYVVCIIYIGARYNTYLFVIENRWPVFKHECSELCTHVYTRYGKVTVIIKLVCESHTYLLYAACIVVSVYCTYCVLLPCDH